MGAGSLHRLAWRRGVSCSTPALDREWGLAALKIFGCGIVPWQLSTLALVCYSRILCNRAVCTHSGGEEPP